MSTDDPQTLLDFWFAPGMQRHWFRSTPALDREIAKRFGETWRTGRDGKLAVWEQTPDGALALTVVLDQLPLNMFRGHPDSFSTEAQARAVADRAIARGFDQGMPAERLQFLYMPFMHSESLADQERSVALFEAAGLTENLRFARHHHDIVARFGRFPHRNAILGRSSTPEEMAWLASPEGFNP
ncbi:MAG: DUF924 domain-containing protein [Gammaproteobacteria bacterium]|nr:MAG: DUF924 domain-containing protein [Gammaproteobacteria bacterium]